MIKPMTWWAELKFFDWKIVSHAFGSVKNSCSTDLVVQLRCINTQTESNEHKSSANHLCSSMD